MSKPRIMRQLQNALFVFGSLAVAWGAAVCAEEATFTAADYLRHIKPMLRDKCYVCHGVLRQEAGLRVDTAAAVRSGSSNGPIIDPANPHQSVLFQRLTTSDPAERMPQEAAPLTAEELERMRRWIAAGAPGPADEQPQPDPRRHWAFQVPRRPPLPRVEHLEWVENPIDLFIVAQYDKHGLCPRPLADRNRWLRRVYLDVLGLPPSEEDLTAFVNDHSPDAYHRAVDRLLASPAYGERWGRHWMDVWRYSDWYGRRMVPDVWNSAPQIWRWRDWIINSLNQDKPYGRMVQEMLAGEELAPEDPDVAVATGFLIRNWYALNPNDWMRSNVEHTAKAFLGLTFNCAHCHDHKYDPISQTDYFRFRAYFEPLGVRQDRVPGQADPGPFQEYEYSKVRQVQRLGLVRAFDKRLDAPTWFYTGGDERNRVADRGSIPPGIPAVFGPSPPIEPVQLPPPAYYPGLRADLRATMQEEFQQKRLAAESQRKKVDATVLPELDALLLKRRQMLAELSQLVSTLKERHPFAGQPALLLDATAGRRILVRSIDGLSGPPENLTIQFDLTILVDGHVNFQLARDASQGLTAAYLGFVRGNIVAYQPGTFLEQPIGTYSPGAERVYRVQLEVHSANDVCLVTVASLVDGQLLVDRAPAALNGWDPSRQRNQPLTWDARKGTRVAVDNIQVAVAVQENGEHSKGCSILWQCDFSDVPYKVGQDVLGSDGWAASSYCEPGGTSMVAFAIATESLTEKEQALLAVDQTIHRLECQIRAAVAEQEAADAEWEAFLARVRADDLRYKQGDDEAAAAAGLEAARLERVAAWRRAQAATAAAALEWAKAREKPQDDPKRGEAIAAAEKKYLAAVEVEHAAQTKTCEPLTPHSYSPLSPIYPQQSSGRRSALARWITAPDNPLFARVAVNHVWLRHFHQPLVNTVFDFGNNGARPTHPELLDWLAVEFIESGYSFKHLHRLILTSRTYRLSSAVGDAQRELERDPENRYLWRMPVGRMEAEVIRDSILACAHLLDRSMGGQELENSDSLTTYRRSIYYSCHPELGGKSPFGELFDGPDANECYRRSRSIMPQQALVLTNSQLVQQASQQLAEKLWNINGGSDQQRAHAEFVQRAFRTLLSREPTGQELADCLEFLAAGVGPQGDNSNQHDPHHQQARRRTGLIRVLFNHNDFIAIR